MPDYFPRVEADLQAWMNQFAAYAGGHLAELGITAAEVAPITAAQADFNGKYAAHTVAHQAAKSARQAKDDSLVALKATVRTLVRRLQASPAVSDAERAALGITVADTVKTVATGAVSSRPLASVATGQRLQHELRIRDEATPTRRAKPEGVMGCEIWVKLAAPGEPAPVDAHGLTFLALCTTGRYVAQYDGAHGGQTAHYLLRWVRKHSAKGPWSETLSATIVA